MQSLNILLIEDDCIDRQSILRQLKQSALSTSLENTIAVAQTGEAGLSLLRDNNYDAVLLDYSLANMTGIEVLEVMNSEELLTMPVIVLSAVDDESLMLKCLEHGAEDYLVKSEVNSKILLRSIRYARERKTLQQQLLTMAKYDSLTGLANRELFTSNLNSVVSKSKRRNVPFAVMFIDLDHFKTINDTLGHATGDELLVSVGGRLSSSVRDGDMVARLGGDEFAVLLEDIKDASNASRIAEKILVDLAPVHQCGQHVINVSLSIGIATYPHCGKDCDSLMKAADAAMYAVKNGGRNGFRFFSSEMQRLVVDRHALETALNDALSHQELSLHYQPLVEADTGRVMATEALIRWHNPLLGPILPSQFIAIAEDLGLINGIGAWVLLTACQQNELWSADLASEPPLMVTINVSLMQLQSAKFVEQLSVLLTQISIAPQQLVVEITEDCLSSAPELVAEVLNQIHALGVLIAIDDFGSGYSSLAVLCSLPLAWLKIDPCFIGGIGVDKAAEGMVKSIIAMAHNLSIKAVAEGVENQQQVDFLKQHRCDMLQGYHIAGPANADVITGILAKKVLS